jgi:broad specificity phosphatase PhoE
MVRLYIARHGQTEWNVQRRLQGNTDTLLDATGRAQALLLAQSMKARHGAALARIYSSPLRRAAETALNIALAVGKAEGDIVQDHRLQEMNLGVLQGLTAAEARKTHPELWLRYTTDDTFVLPDGESVRAFNARVLEAFEDIARRHVGEEDVVVVTHGGVLDMLRQHLAPEAQFERRCSNASVSVFEVAANGRCSLVAWNDIAHLKELHGLSGGADDVRARA